MILVTFRAEADTAPAHDQLVDLEHLFKILPQLPPTALARTCVRWCVLATLLRSLLLNIRKVQVEPRPCVRVPGEHFPKRAAPEFGHMLDRVRHVNQIVRNAK